MTDEELKAYALKGMRSDVIEKVGAVKQAMVRMKESFDRAVPGHAAKASYSAPIDNLMSSLVALSEALDKAEAFAKEGHRGN